MSSASGSAPYTTTAIIISAAVRSAIFNGRDAGELHANRTKLMCVLELTPQVIYKIFGYNSSCGYNSAIETIEHYCVLKSKFIEKAYGGVFYYSSDMAPITSKLALVKESLTIPVTEFFTTLVGADIWEEYEDAIKTRYVSLSVDEPKTESEPMRFHVLPEPKTIGICTKIPIVNMKYFILGYAQAIMVIIDTMGIQLEHLTGEELKQYNSVIVTYHILLLRILDVLDEIIRIDLKYGLNE
jgi:hypothetical protein